MRREVLLQEIESLIRILDFIQGEKYFFKQKLSTLLDNTVNYDVLTWAESLHKEILDRETEVQLLKSDIIGLKNLVKSKLVINNLMDPNTTFLFKKYKEHLWNLESEFFIWKNQVNEKFENTVY